MLYLQKWNAVRLLGSSCQHETLFFLFFSLSLSIFLTFRWRPFRDCFVKTSSEWKRLHWVGIIGFANRFSDPLLEFPEIDSLHPSSSLQPSVADINLDLEAPEFPTVHHWFHIQTFVIGNEIPYDFELMLATFALFDFCKRRFLFQCLEPKLLSNFRVQFIFCCFVFYVLLD